MLRPPNTAPKLHADCGKRDGGLCVHTLALGPLLLLLSGGLERCKCQPGELVEISCVDRSRS